MRSNAVHPITFHFFFSPSCKLVLRALCFDGCLRKIQRIVGRSTFPCRVALQYKLTINTEVKALRLEPELQRRECVGGETLRMHTV